jgi:hypothetical protein
VTFEIMELEKVKKIKLHCEKEVDDFVDENDAMEVSESGDGNRCVCC